MERLRSEWTVVLRCACALCVWRVCVALSPCAPLPLVGWLLWLVRRPLPIGQIRPPTRSAPIRPRPYSEIQTIRKTSTKRNTRRRLYRKIKTENTSYSPLPPGNNIKPRHSFFFHFQINLSCSTIPPFIIAPFVCWHAEKGRRGETEKKATFLKLNNIRERQKENIDTKIIDRKRKR